jgi:hypothetical protein
MRDWGLLDQLDRFDRRQGHGNLGFLCPGGTQVNLVGREVGIHAGGYAYHLDFRDGSNPDRLIVVTGIAQERDDLVVVYETPPGGKS